MDVKRELRSIGLSDEQLGAVMRHIPDSSEEQVLATVQQRSTKHQVSGHQQ